MKADASHEQTRGEISLHPRSEKYDAYYDKTTRFWLEPKCGDKWCPYCKDRPLTAILEKP